ncbi:MAG TPA: DUF4112 domain-containing protein [Nostocaceae cyanobacterium]|nr:DUF4112 domain-containing protein [Nostocaceae cyanobacterium]
MSNGPQFYLTTDAYAPKLKRLRQLAKLLDKAITLPGTKAGVGLDALIGLLPIGGDALGLIFSFYIIIEAARLGVSNNTLGKMIFNVIIDSLAGSFPMLGDLFDIAWTANSFNIDLLEQDLKSSKQPRETDRKFLLILMVGLILLGIVLLAIPVLLLALVWQAVTGS